ncbi:MAG: radical SAM protein [Deltaproteobacteria bacterium]|nr:radical SAM protein [Deltaproteobacteria bacterium]
MRVKGGFGRREKSEKNQSPLQLRQSLLALESGLRPRERGGKLTVALIWPGSYHAGMSSLGYLWVYGYLNSRPDAMAERFFCSESELNRSVSLESGLEVGEFNVAAASMSVENEYWRLLDILWQSKIEVERVKRKSGPLIVAGGVGVWSNPWPLWQFVDLFVLGEGEAQWPSLVDCLISPMYLKADYLKRLELIVERVSGALAPALIENRPEELNLSNLYQNIKVRPASLSYPYQSSLLPPVSPIITPKTEFSSSALVEIARGCPWGCRFCLTGFLYRPYRPWSEESIIKALEPWLKKGAKVGLVSPAVAEHKSLESIIDRLYELKIWVSLSSLRLSALSENLARKMARGGLKALAVAPEAGSIRLRAAINKNITEDEILSSARLLALSGLRRLKLYFMIGLPFESEEDLEQLWRLVARIKKETSLKGGGPLIVVSVANFTPKPHTPFEDEALATEEEMRAKGTFLARGFKGLSGVELKLDPPKWSIVNALLSRGGPLSGELTRQLWLNQGKSGPALKAIGYAPTWPDHEKGALVKSWKIVAAPVGQTFLEVEKSKSAQYLNSSPCPASLNCLRCGAFG